MNLRKILIGRPARRAAFTLVETLLALSFLAIAAGLTLKTHQARLDFDREAMQRLTYQLNVENIAERLSLVSYEDLPDAVKQVNEDNGVIVRTDSFESDRRSVWHVQIRSASDDPSLTQHLWKWEPKP